VLALLIAGAGAWLLRAPRAGQAPAPRELARIALPSPTAAPHAAAPTLAAADSPAPEPQAASAATPQAAATSAAQAPAAHALSRGVVNVATPGGWADVFVAGRHRGRTPLQLELPEGRRTLLLKPFGSKPLKREVFVRPGQVTRLVVHVHPMPGNVHAPE
jgi:hypothetical protein